MAPTNAHSAGKPSYLKSKSHSGSSNDSFLRVGTIGCTRGSVIAARSAPPAVGQTLALQPFEHATITAPEGAFVLLVVEQPARMLRYLVPQMYQPTILWPTAAMSSPFSM